MNVAFWFNFIWSVYYCCSTSKTLWMSYSWFQLVNILYKINTYHSRQFKQEHIRFFWSCVWLWKNSFQFISFHWSAFAFAWICMVYTDCRRSMQYLKNEEKNLMSNIVNVIHSFLYIYTYTNIDHYIFENFIKIPF